MLRRGAQLLRRASRIEHSVHSSASRENSSAQLAVTGLVRSGLTCGAITLVGDVLAQGIIRGKDDFANLLATDSARAVRMGGYGFCIYGPLMWKWYPLLESIWPTHSLQHTLCKIASNQLLLGPTILLTSFAWNYALTSQLHKLPAKLSQDAVPTMINGWMFWVPAAALNFTVVPLPHRLAFMSVCGVCWTGYLSARANSVEEQEAKAVSNAV